MNLIKIRNELRPEIEKISKEYSYLSISKTILNSMVDDILEEFLRESSMLLNMEFNEYFLEKLDQYVKGYIVYQFMNHNDDILNQFIKYNINIKRGINELGKIEKLFRETGYEVDISIYTDMIKRNSTISKMIQKFLKTNQKQLKQGTILDLVDESVMLFIESYCLENKIELGEQTNEKLDEAIDHLEQQLDNLEQDKRNHEIEIEGTDYLNIDIQKQYIKEVKRLNKKLLTKEEEIGLSKRIALKDQEARKELAEANLRLVLSKAPKYQNRGLPLEDLIQSGNEGLMKAVDHFDPKKGRFSTYANIWIKQSILYAIYHTARTVRIPAGVLHKIRDLKKAEENLVDKLKRNPEVDEIAKELKCLKEDVYYLQQINQDVDSLNRSVTTKHDENVDILDFIYDDSQNIERKVEQSFLSKELLKIMDKAKLKEAEKETLYLRYGLELTLEEAAKVQNVSYEWVRQLQIKGLQKMRDYAGMKSFAIYMDHPDQVEKTLEFLKDKESKEQKKKKSKKKTRCQ